MEPARTAPPARGTGTRAPARGGGGGRTRAATAPSPVARAGGGDARGNGIVAGRARGGGDARGNDTVADRADGAADATAAEREEKRPLSTLVERGATRASARRVRLWAAAVSALVVEVLWCTSHGPQNTRGKPPDGRRTILTHKGRERGETHAGRLTERRWRLRARVPVAERGVRVERASGGRPLRDGGGQGRGRCPESEQRGQDSAHGIASASDRHQNLFPLLPKPPSTIVEPWPTCQHVTNPMW